MEDDELTATSYEIYRWDCPVCGEVNETGDVQPNGEERCDGCGAIVEVN